LSAASIISFVAAVIWVIIAKGAAATIAALLTNTSA
jgi:hypothetical protein